MIATLDRFIGRLGNLRWLAVPIGALAAAMSGAALWLLFLFKDFSSHVRDAYEAPPGPVQYVVFALLCASLLLLFALGVSAIVLGLRRGKVAPGE